MRVVDIRVDAHEDEVHLYLPGDAHSGTKYHAEHEFARTIQRIRDDPVGRWIDMGDKADFITPSDPRWKCGSIASWVHEDNIALDQGGYYCDVVQPIAPKCDGSIDGNHEDAIRQHCHVNIQQYITDKLGVRNLGFMALIHYTFYVTKTRCYGLDVVVTHGSGAGITRGAKINRLERLMNGFDAQVFGHGHVHEIILHPGMPYLYRAKAGRLKQRRKVGAMTGCFFRTYTQDVEASYGERKNYPPTMIGCPMFVITPSTGAVEVRA